MKPLKFLILGFSILLLGCTEPTPPKIIVKDKLIYVSPEIPNISNPPIAQEYQVLSARINKKDYYLIPVDDGLIMTNNWERYRIWAVTNYNILQKLKKHNVK